MRKTLVAAASLAVINVASAQSSMTLYGVVDAMLANDRLESTTGAGVTTVNRQTRVSSGGLSGSRWGMRVREDLGAGLTALATLESGFNIDTGTLAQGGRVFGRQSFVGIAGGFGQLTLGRQYSAYEDYRVVSDKTGNSTFSPAVGYVDGGATLTGVFATVGSNYTARVDNSIKYETPANFFGGFSAGVQYGFAENRSALQDAGHIASFKIGYTAGPLWAGGAYQQEQNYTGGNSATPAAALTGAPRLTHGLLGTSYDFGVAKLFAAYNMSRRTSTTGAALAALPAGTAATVASSARDREAQVGVIVALGATSVRAGYAVARSTSGLAGTPTERGTGTSVEVLHSLSKRTTVYAAGMFTQDRNDGYVAGASVKRRQFGAGMRHTF